LFITFITSYFIPKIKVSPSQVETWTMPSMLTLFSKHKISTKYLKQFLINQWN
jgi:hypothetical protein